MNPEDPTQFDALASQLSSLQPASATRLQALTFFEAGRRAASTRHAPALLKLRSLSAALAIVIACSAASYYAGSQRSALLNSDTSDNLAIIDLAQPNSPPTSTSVETEPSAPELADQELSEQQLGSDREPARGNSSTQLLSPIWVSWFQLPQRNAEDYLRNIEMRTRPPLSRSAASTDPINSSPVSLDRHMPELEQLQFDSPLRKWLSM